MLPDGRTVPTSRAPELAHGANLVCPGHCMAPLCTALHPATIVTYNFGRISYKSSLPLNMWFDTLITERVMAEMRERLYFPMAKNSFILQQSWEGEEQRSVLNYFSRKQSYLYWASLNLVNIKEHLDHPHKTEFILPYGPRESTTTKERVISLFHIIWN